MIDFTELIDLVSEKLGGAVLYANDEFFAPKENLLKPGAPIFIEGKYTDLGKWMDGWETRRRRSPRLDEKFDWCIIRLGLVGIIHGVVVDTSFFRGNFPSHCSIEVCALDGQPDVEQLLSAEWTEILPHSELQGDSHNHFEINYAQRVTHLRLKIYPDGGVARLRVFGEVLPDWETLRARNSEIDLAAAEHGGTVLKASDMFFGHRHNLIMPGRAQDMSDGWESKRRRGEGYDWCVIKLGTSGTIKRVEVDTLWFKGNYPESCSIEVGNAGETVNLEEIVWQELLPNSKLQAHTRHIFVDELKKSDAVTHVRFNIFPDGGVSRLRLFGRIAE
ncbi:MAG: allantoicase [Acidobacteriota bacterium]|jgi:allantoicase|nr:allantoicase [Acidobacteriota bacterium]